MPKRRSRSSGVSTWRCSMMRADVGRVLLDQRDHAVGERLAQIVPRAIAQGVGRVLQEDAHDVLARRRERRVVHGGDGQLQQGALGRPAVLGVVPGALDVFDARGRCAWWRGGAGPGAPGIGGEFRQAGERQVDLAAGAFDAEMADGGEEIGVEVARVEQAQEGDLGVEVGGHRGALRSPRRSPAPRRKRGRRAPAPWPPARWCGSPRRPRAPRRRWPPRPRPCRRARSPTARDVRPRRPCNGAAGCRPCPGERGPPLAPITPSVASVTFTCSDSNHSSRNSAALWVKILTSATRSCGPRPRKPRGELQVVDEIAGPRGGNCGGVVSSRPSTTCERRSSWSS